MSHLTITNAQLSSHLDEKSAAVTAVNETIHILKAASRPSGGGAATAAIATPIITRSSNGGSARARPVTDNENYRWSHGYHIHADHTRLTCTRRAE
jgi:hypothetical protein